MTVASSSNGIISNTIGTVRTWNKSRESDRWRSFLCVTNRFWIRQDKIIQRPIHDGFVIQWFLRQWRPMKQDRLCIEERSRWLSKKKKKVWSFYTHSIQEFTTGWDTHFILSKQWEAILWSFCFLTMSNNSCRAIRRPLLIS